MQYSRGGNTPDRPGQLGQEHPGPKQLHSRLAEREHPRPKQLHTRLAEREHTTRLEQEHTTRLEQKHTVIDASTLKLALSEVI